MIDTIKGYMELTEEHSINMAIFEQGHVTSSSTGYRTARLNNFTIKVKFNEDNAPVRLRFIGSLPKLYYGNNLAQLDWEATQDALQMLSDNLHIDIFEANLTRIDFGFNFLLKRSVQYYLNLLSSRTRFQKVSYQDETVGFSAKAKTIIFYDKLAEIRKKDKSTFENIPELYKGLNVMRCEVRLLKNIRASLGTKQAVKVKDLISERTQKKLVEIFFSEFSKVHTSDDLDPLHLLKKHNGILKYLSFYGIEMLGFDRVVGVINTIDLDVKNPSVKRSKLKSEVRKVQNEAKENILDTTPIQELNRKVEFIKNLI